MSIRFEGRVAIVTGAGGGLGRAHAMGLAARGAKVVIADVGAARDGTGRSLEAAEAVVSEIAAKGGEAMAVGVDVANSTEVDVMVGRALSRFSRIDILINNAGILRDKSFAKMTAEDFRLVLDVHLMGSVNCAKAVWDAMRTQNYGRIVFTSSGSGIYGNFGQSNYGAAKTAMIGLMNVLHLEGRKHDIRVNTLAPTAGTRMTEGLVPPDIFALMTPESITPGVLYLVSEDAPSRVILAAGAGTFARTLITETEGVYFPEAERTPENIAARFDEISDPAKELEIEEAFDQTYKLVSMAAKAMGIEMPKR
ncbi:SDR family NAD(P)-dependent oxidoreductase [Terrarubrum flagellatum]|uniref:SDR family NAD(P)-dependent oxidoreductase n=1 Tax=Terrirubrum flagellatum TaxID=2895980 RepID=UPI00314556E3